MHGGEVFASVLGNAPTPLRGIRTADASVHADGPRLTALARAGLRLRVAGTLPLERVAEAHQLVERAGLRGRMVLLPSR